MTLNGPRCTHRNEKKSTSIGNGAQLGKICPLVRTESGNALMFSDRHAEKRNGRETLHKRKRNRRPRRTLSFGQRRALLRRMLVALPNAHSLLPLRRCLLKMHAKKKNVKRGHNTASCPHVSLRRKMSSIDKESASRAAQRSFTTRAPRDGTNGTKAPR